MMKTLSDILFEKFTPYVHVHVHEHNYGKLFDRHACLSANQYLILKNQRTSIQLSESTFLFVLIQE